MTATDEEGGILIDSVTVTVIESENELPVAKAGADKLSGTAPLAVKFTGSGSTDDGSVKGHFWDFKDGSTSAQADPAHTFSEPGTYQVELTVTDENDLTDKAEVAITVAEPANQAPVAVAAASVLSGDAPLQVAFTGSGSSDDKGVVGYTWDFQGGSSSSANATYTFDDPGVYNVSLTVADGQGLRDTAALTVTVGQAVTGGTGGGRIPCSVGGGRAGDTGAKIWCWENVSVPSGASSGNMGFSDGQLALNTECSANQVTNVGNRLRFHLNPTSPAPSSWCNNDFNMRAEIYATPWDVDHPVGTEEWFGWSYTFGNGYIVDRDHDWSLFQVHEGTIGTSPLISLHVTGKQGGTIKIVNATQSGPNNTYSDTGVSPRAGQKVDIVMHIIWGDDSNGLLQVWMDGNKVYDAQVRTVRASTRVGGNAKWGIYYSPWRSASAVQSSAQQGIRDIEMFMGTLRTITRRPGDQDYRKDSYSQVAPD